MKKALSLLLVCVFVLGLGIMSGTAQAIPGDVNNDGEITIFDALFIVKAVVNDIALENSDVNGDGKTNLLDAIGVIKLIATGETPEVGEQDKSSADIVVENGVVKEAVSINGESFSAAVPEGVAVEEGATSLTLSVTALDDTSGNITTEEDEELVSYDVHVDGVSEDNTVAIVVDLGAILPAGQNMGTVVLYHVENGDTVKMTQVMSLAELDEHNEFYYYPETGNVYVAMATFSEVSAVANTVNPWDGKSVDYTWYTKNPDADSFTIANADQLVAFARIVGPNMAKYDNSTYVVTKYEEEDGKTYHFDDFAGKTVTLLSDINLNDTIDENGKVFYPIGYANSVESFEKKSGVNVTSSVYSFEGTFDGAGHTIANFYQNTWEMFGDYNNGYSGTPNHYKDGMGLFGYVVNGTVKNLTVKNFSSDGEFTPTGVIAAYARNSTFENIAIVNCNPRVYNTGNGGIVGIGGNDNDPETDKLTFKNITIDNTNKITALWGSWDVACGGLVGMFRGAGHVYMTDCHVAAQIDVYNDVCGNYQYYWYRYAGMLIGTNKTMITDTNGYTVPDTSKYHAKDCTVHFDTWNDYYYCELVANSLASYTHDHQFSRLEIIDSKDAIWNNETRAWTEAGNFIVLGKNGNHTCYHIVNNNGVLEEHTHESAGKEIVDGVEVLKEDKQCVYLPFNQLFTGYGWGVKHVPIYDDGTTPFAGVTVRGREYTDSVLKFTGSDKYYTTGMTVKASDLFAEIDNKIGLKEDSVIVSVTPTANSKASATVVKGDSWENTTIKFGDATGNLMIAIQDYYFCAPTIINVTVLDSKYYHIDANGESKLKWVKDGNKYDLYCDGCNKTIVENSDTPVVYLDHSGSDEHSLNFSLGVDADYPVRTLAEATKRLTTTGGTITLASDIIVGSTGLNNPKDVWKDGVPNKMTPWAEPVTFNGDKNGDGVADFGFTVNSHGPSIYFEGPTVFKNLIIDGTHDKNGNPAATNNSDNGNYNIPVFVANWNDFTFGEGIVAKSPFYFIVGNYFYRSHDAKTGEEKYHIYYYYKNNYGNLTWDTYNLAFSADGNRYTSYVAPDGQQKEVNIVFNKIESTWEGGLEAYDRIYLGTRNRTFDSLTVKNAHVNVTSNDASFNFVYAGSASGSYKLNDGIKEDGTIENDDGTLTVVDTQMINCSLDIDFNGSESADAYLRLFRIGNSNSGNSGTAYLDKLDLALDGTFYVKKSDAENKDSEVVTEKFFTVSNVKDLNIIISDGAERTREDDTIAYNEMAMTLKLGDAYCQKNNEKRDEIVNVEYGTHSFLKTLTKLIVIGKNYTDSNFTVTVDESDCDPFGMWVVDANDSTKETHKCEKCGNVRTRNSDNKTHEHTTYITGTKGNFVLKCETCGIVGMYRQPETAYEHGEDRPVIYVDVKKEVNTEASDENFGFSVDNAVASLHAAVSRLKETGGTIKLMSNVEINSGSLNHPLGTNYKLTDWKKEITFSSYKLDSNNEPTTGFKINNHGVQIHFNGPAKLKNILIDGRVSDKAFENNVDKGNYNIPVFVANWYSFAVSAEGVVAYGKCFFVIGNYFASNRELAEYKDAHVPFFSGNSDTGYTSNRMVDGKIDTISVTLYPITEKPIDDNDQNSAVSAYGRVYLGNRDESKGKDTTNANTCTTINTAISFNGHGIKVDNIYVGSYDSKSETYTFNPVKNSTVSLTFDGDSVIKKLETGNNFRYGTAELEGITIKLDGKSRFDNGDASKEVINVCNAKVVDFRMKVSDRTNSDINVGCIVFDKSNNYNVTGGKFILRIPFHYFNYQTGVDNWGLPKFNETLYGGNKDSRYFLINSNCNYSTTTCTCGRTQTIIDDYKNSLIDLGAVYEKLDF